MKVEHEETPWCWCRPRVRDMGDRMVIHHFDVTPDDVPGLSGHRVLGGGPEYEDDGLGSIGPWVQEAP